MLQLRDILEPLIFSAFLVAAIEKPVDSTHRFLSGRCECCKRRSRNLAVGSPAAAMEEARSAVGAGTQQAQTTSRGSAETAEEARPVMPRSSSAPTFREMIVEEAVACDGCLRILAVITVLFLISLFLFGIGAMVFYSALHMKEEWPVYKDGAIRVFNSTEVFVDQILHNLHVPQGDVDAYIRHTYQGFLTGAETMLWKFLNEILTDVSGAFSWILLTFLYVFFWLLKPLPQTDKLNELVRSYILKKTIICLGYGVCVAMLFFSLHIDLAAVFGLLAFILNYLPEVGPFLSMCLPIPVILLDGRISNPGATLCAATLGQILLKFLFTNYLEVILVENDKMMAIHPIWILLGLTFFGFVWGPVGMLLSVPILALVKVAAVPENEIVPKPYGLPILACLEGRAYRKGEVQ